LLRAGEAAKLVELRLHAAQASFECVEAIHELGHGLTIPADPAEGNDGVDRRR
jgi:2-methylcitrate dehydratase PrpD